jgi:GT2 family glycosyltransferase
MVSDSMAALPRRWRRKRDFVALADSARDARQWGAAAQLYREALDRNPRNPSIWVQYGHALKESGALRDPDKLAQAEVAYRRALSLKPGLADSYLQLGHVLKLQGKSEEAKASYLRAFVLDPAVTFALDELGALGWSAAETAELVVLVGDCEAHGGLPPHSGGPKVAIAETSPPAAPTHFRLDFAPGTFLRGCLDEAKDWYFRLGRKISVIIPSYRDTELLAACIKALRNTTSESMVSIIVVDDFSQDDEHSSFLRSLSQKYTNVRVVFGEKNIGFSGNVNRGLALCPDEDVVLMNSDVVPLEGWLEMLQHAVYRDDAAIGGARLVYPNGTIQFGGGFRNVDSPRWFDHLFRKKPGDYAPATMEMPSLFVTGALMYLRHGTLRKIGRLDPAFPMAFEDVDLCLRAWAEGLRTLYVGAACGFHIESATRGFSVGEREQRSQDYFWEKHQGFFQRNIHHRTTGKPYVVFVTQSIGVDGGRRVILSHINYLVKNGFTVELWNLTGYPEWFELEPLVKVRVFGTYYELTRELSKQDAIKVATWWETAECVWLASVRNGIPLYHVQDIEPRYYRNDPVLAAKVLSRYRPEFNYTTNSEWIKSALESRYRVNAVHIGFGYQSERFHRLDGVERRARSILVAVRGGPLKNFGYSKSILARLQEHGVKIIGFGNEGTGMLGGLENVEFHPNPNDDALCRLYNQAQFFIQTSIHEGFSLPPIEAMACGCVPIITETHGNLEYLQDRGNCVIIPLGDVDAAVATVLSVIDQDELLNNIARGGLDTARRYEWDRAHRRLGQVLKAIVARPEYGLPVRDRDLD